MSNRNALQKKQTKMADKSNSYTSHKHSGIFYISPSLFNNKSLKQKRLKWQTHFKNKKFDPQRLQEQVNISKTDRRLKHSTLQPDITIDLLSDDENDINQQNSTVANASVLLKTKHNCISPSENTNKTHWENWPKNHLNSSNEINNKSFKRKRKLRPPKRHSEPTIINNESIILSDDSDVELKNTAQSINVLARNSSSSIELNSLSPLATKMPEIVAQVDDEVTVSLVPRSSTAGNCSKPNDDKLFPMLPDETTVHTVIANRLYELSLTKLREGLGIADLADGQQRISPTRRKGTAINPPVADTPPAPIALKLSSDLSISLISDDEEEQDPKPQQKQQTNATNVLHQEQQLVLQQLQMQLPTITIATAGGTYQLPRRRKLS